MDERGVGSGELALSNEDMVVVFAEFESFGHFEEKEELLVNGFLHLGHDRDREIYEIPCPSKNKISFFFFFDHCLDYFFLLLCFFSFCTLIRVGCQNS